MYINILTWLQETEIDLLQIVTYIMQDSIFYAQQTNQNINGKVKILESFPYIGRTVPEINQYTIRELIYKSYRIIYQIYQNKIYIIRVIHSSRNILQV